MTKERTDVDLQQTIFQLIDARSFSNLWYWIALAAVWSSATYYVMGIPYDVVQRARKNGGQFEQDLDDLVRIYAKRLLLIGSVAGLWIIGFICFALTGLAGLGFVYGLELAQAVFLIFFPMSIVAAMSLSLARLIVDRDLRGDALQRRLTIHRVFVQVLGAVSIFVTAGWGMYHNLTAGGFLG